MFPSCGFFSSFPCPFYVNGLCERPYCHFRHSRHDVERARRENNVSILSSISDSPESSTSHSPEQQSSVSGDSSHASALSKPQSSSSLFGESSLISGSSGKTSLQPNSSNFESSVGSVCIPSFTGSTYQVPVAEEQPEQYETPQEKDSDPLLGSSSLSGPNTGATDLPAYLPTPKTPSLPIPEPAKDDDGIPVYQPTPKVELKRRHKEQTPTKKAKSADLEYDPVSNYSCGGLIGLPHEEYQPEEEDAVDYKPTEKKARLSKSTKAKKKHRLSCESLTAGSTKDLTEDQEIQEGVFSDEEKDGSGSRGPSVEAMEEDVIIKDDKSDNFENIGDDDISSDDDFIDVPNLPHSKPDFKPEKHSVKQMNRKSSVHGLEKSKTVSKKKDYSKAVSEKTNSSGSKHNHNKTKHASSKSSHKLPSESSSHKTIEKTSKVLSSEKKAGQSSSANNLKKSSSASGQCKEKCHSSHKLVHSSKHLAEQKTEHRKSELLSKSKAEAIKSKHTHSLSSSKSISKPEKSHISSKHVSPSGKLSSSSSTLVSNNSSERRPSSDGKQKSSLDRRSSSDSSSKGGTSKLSCGEKHPKIMHSEAGRKSSSGSDTKNSVKHSDSKTSEKLDKSSAGKKHKVCVCEKCCRSNNKTSSPGRSSSSGCKTGGAESHSSSSTSRKTSFSAGDQSKDRSVHSNKAHSASKSGKDGRSLHIESQKKSSSSKNKVYHHLTKPDKECRSSQSDIHMNNSGLGKHSLSVNSKSSSSQNKKQSDSRSDSRVKSSSSSSSSKTLQRMNSSIFGDDSEEEVTEDMMPCDDDTLPDLTNDFSDNGGGVEEEQIDYSKYIHESDLEDDDTFDECLRIFTETPLPKKATGQPDKKLIKDQKKEGPGPSEEIHRVSGKKRIAHKAAEEARRPELVKKERPRHLMSPQEQMHNRIMLMQQRAQERLRAAQQAVQEQEVSSTSGAAPGAQPSRLNTGIKKRVAHVPKAVVPSTSSAGKAPSSNNQKKATVVGTASKTEKRVAHTPNVTNLKRPMIPASFGSKVPSNIRQRYLNLIIDECLRFCPSEEQAYKKGLEEEAGVYERSSNKNIYLRVAVNAITRLRTEAKESMPGSSTSSLHQPSSVRSQSHEATLGGARAAKTNFTLHRTLAAGKKTEVVLTAPELYQRLAKYTMSEEQLVENGYPRPCPDTPGKAVIQGKSYQDTDTLLKANERTCSRCGKRFIVKSDGRYVREEECVYHWTRAYPRKKSGFFQHIYNCCNSDTSSKGCQVAGNHVHEKNKRDGLTGFMRTMPCSPPRDGNYGIYALDCEMVYTIGGLELARVTVVDTEGKSVFESLVQPFNPIVDYNTRFSGLTKADLKDVETTLTEVQAVLLNMFSAKTILIGHSLESDLFALKLIHSTVVDTSVVFPHRLGPPYKRALKNLMLDIFQKIIQCDDGGHDSKEDALACLQLMKWRIKEDSKRENRYSRD